MLVSDDTYLHNKTRMCLLAETICKSITYDRFDLAIQLWKKYQIILTQSPAKIVEQLVVSFEESMHFFEFKTYFFV